MSHLISRGLERLAIATLLVCAALGGVGFGQAGGSNHFTIFIRGVRIGFEDIRLARTPTGWLISSTGRQEAPIDLVTNKLDIAYAADWQPQQLSIEGTSHGRIITLDTSFGLTTAVNDMLQGGQKSSVTHQLSPRAIVLPNNFYGAYEALAARLDGAAPGAQFPIYVAPQAEITATVNRVTPRRIVSPSGTVELRQFDLTFANPSGPVGVEIWIDQANRFARLVMAGPGLSVVRDDISSVMSREETIRNPGDEDTFIPAAGFNLAATVTKPREAGGRLPAVVLVAGSGPQDRDETVFGIPVFGQLAGAMADAGFFVVRYDKRGVGQSGGRIEKVTLDDYADDVVSTIAWLRKRKDIDPDRIAVVGHSEGGAVALLVGSRGNHVAALGLLATPGVKGREVTLWQQQHALARMNATEAEKQSKTALQLLIMNAVETGSGWEAVPEALRRSVDSAWFRSWLLFDPAPAMARTRQPVLILQGSLDTQIPPAQADRLEELARARKLPATHTRKVVVPGVNHLLVAAGTGEVDEYPNLPARTIAPDVTRALTGWLTDVLAPARKK